MKAKVVPWSSVVGQSIMLLDKKGAVIAQLLVMNIKSAGLEVSVRKERATQIAIQVTKAINDAP